MVQHPGQQEVSQPRAMQFIGQQLAGGDGNLMAAGLKGGRYRQHHRHQMRIHWTTGQQDTQSQPPPRTGMASPFRRTPHRNSMRRLYTPGRWRVDNMWTPRPGTENYPLASECRVAVRTLGDESLHWKRFPRRYAARAARFCRQLLLHQYVIYRISTGGGFNCGVRRSLPFR